MTRWILVIALLLGGCCHFRVHELQLVGTTDEESRWAESAAQQWCDKSDFCPRIVESSTNTIGLTKDQSILSGPDVVGEVWEHVDKRTGIAAVRILVLDRRDLGPFEWLPRWRRIVLHEIGHIGGCPDFPDDDLVMSGALNDVEDLRQRDIDCLQVD